MIPFLFTMGLCALSHATTLSDPIPVEEKVHVVSLSNGVKAYIQEHAIPPHCGSFRVVLKRSSHEDEIYALESLEEVEQFFTDCSERDSPQEMAVVAVGDFPAKEMQHLIEKHFGGVQLAHHVEDADEASGQFLNRDVYNEGFGEEEFEVVAKDQLLYRKDYLSSRSVSPDNALLASSYAGQFLLEGAPPLLTLVDKIEPEQFQLADRQEYCSPQFVFANNPGDSTMPFYQLPITEKEKRLINIIITTMAEKNILQLALVKRSMEKKGKKIDHVHPMRFLGYILSSSELRGCLRTIKKSSFKWDAFVGGFGRRMKEEYSNNNLYVHIPGFCQQVGGNPDVVTRYIHKKDWEGLIKEHL